MKSSKFRSLVLISLLLLYGSFIAVQSLHAAVVKSTIPKTTQAPQHCQPVATITGGAEKVTVQVIMFTGNGMITLVDGSGMQLMQWTANNMGENWRGFADDKLLLCLIGGSADRSDVQWEFRP